MTIQKDILVKFTPDEFNLLMNLLDAHVENLSEWVVTEEDKDMVEERDAYSALFARLNLLELEQKREE